MTEPNNFRLIRGLEGVQPIRAMSHFPFEEVLSSPQRRRPFHARCAPPAFSLSGAILCVGMHFLAMSVRTAATCIGAGHRIVRPICVERVNDWVLWVILYGVAAGSCPGGSSCGPVSTPV